MSTHAGEVSTAPDRPRLLYTSARHCRHDRSRKQAYCAAWHHPKLQAVRACSVALAAMSGGAAAAPMAPVEPEVGGGDGATATGRHAGSDCSVLKNRICSGMVMRSARA